MAEKKQQLQVEVPEELLRVHGDHARFVQALSNLLPNVSKFTPEGGQMTVKLERDAEAGFRLSVTDTGIGIKIEDLDRVFEPFAAIEKPTNIKGTGLGLGVAKALVEAHGGRIWVESSGVGKGTSFTLTIPESKRR